MSTIYKYLIRYSATPKELEMPEGAQVIYVGEQLGSLYLWAIVDLSRPLVKRKFAVLPTGYVQFDATTMRHLGTVQVGEFVWHVFEPYYPLHS